MKRRHRLALVTGSSPHVFEYAIAAEVFALERPGLGVPWYRVGVVGAGRGRLETGLAGVAITPTAAPAFLDQAETIVLTPWAGAMDGAPARLLQALRRAHARGARLLSICTASFVLAEAGLLDGRRAATHWMHADAFRRRYPAVQLVDDVLYVDEGSIITSAGSGAGIDACLHLVRRDHGARVAGEVARRMVLPPHREGGQAQYVGAPVAPHPADSVGLGLDWARARLHRPLSVPEWAARMPMSERTFLRRFHAAMGMAPLRWLQQQRMQRARELLEEPARPIADIATACGYESPETFRSAFRRIVGVAPGAYRARFAGSR